jgi:hypothetical protein
MRAAIRRLSREDTLRFAELIRAFMRECHLSGYSLFLGAEFPRATLMRWLSGESRIPVDAAQTLVASLTSHAETISKSSAIKELQALLNLHCVHDVSASRLHLELRARRIPIRRTLEALRAANVLPPGPSVG